MDKVLILYDLTGKVWSIIYGASEAPDGIPAVWCDVPKDAIIDHVDPVTKEVIFTYLPETDLGQLQQEVKAMGKNVSDIDSSLSNVKIITNQNTSDITDTQQAITELYDLIEGGMA